MVSLYSKDGTKALEKESSAKYGVDPYLAVVLIAAIVYLAFWMLSVNYVYNTFSDSYFDMGVLPNSFYMHLYYPGLTPGLQYLVFACNLSPFMLLFLPVYAIWSSPLTLVALQDIFLIMTAVIVYIICKDILKNRLFGLIMSILFMANAGVIGPLIFNMHFEAFIPFFYLLSFYFFMRGSVRWFIPSYILLLSIVDSVQFICITLIAGLAYYEFMHYKRSCTFDKDVHRRRLMVLCITLVLTLVFEIFYSWVVNTLLYDYSIGMYSSLPPTARVINYVAIQESSLLHPGVMSLNAPQYAVMFDPVGLPFLFLAFGFTSLIDPLLTVLLIGQWIIEVFYLGNWGFAIALFPYYLYVIGGSFAASILGIKIMQDLKAGEGKIILRLFRNVNYVRAAALPLGLCVSMFLLAELSSVILSTALAFITHSAGPISNFTAIDAALATIPQNATIMAQSNIEPHLTSHMELELSPAFQQPVPTFYSNTPVITSFYWFRPQYIAIDRDALDYDNEMNSSNFSVYSYMGDNYSVYYNASGFSIYKLK